MIAAARLGTRGQREWRSRGWTLVPGFLGEGRLAALRGECDRLKQQPALFEQRGAVPFSLRRTDRLDPVIDVSPEFRSLAHDPDLLLLIGEAIGGPLQLFKDKYIAKPPGTNGYGLHVDGAYWLGMDLDLDRFASAMIFIDDSTLDKGVVECANGWHALGVAGEPVTDPLEGSAGVLVQVEATAGDVLLLHARTPHRSNGNHSAEPRRVLLFTYGVDARPGLYDRYQQHRLGMTQ
jgi:hypothetical protein